MKIFILMSNVNIDLVNLLCSQILTDKLESDDIYFMNTPGFQNFSLLIKRNLGIEDFHMLDPNYSALTTNTEDYIDNLHENFDAEIVFVGEDDHIIPPITPYSTTMKQELGTIIKGGDYAKSEEN